MKWIKQELKELDHYLDDLSRQTEKDAGNLWIQFTDKFNAFKKRLNAEAESTPAIPSSIVRALEEANPYPYEQSEESKYEIPNYIAWNKCIMKLRELLSSQPAEQGEGVELIRKERIRQIQKEGWDNFHDEHHGNMELTGAACCYASSAINKYFKEKKVRFEIHLPAETSMEAGNTEDRGDRRLRPAGWFDAWPWNKESDKREKHDILRSLVIAGALIASEIDRLTTHQPKKEDKS